MVMKFSLTSRKGNYMTKKANRQLRRMEKLGTLTLPRASLLCPLEKGEDAERKERQKMHASSLSNLRIFVGRHNEKLGSAQKCDSRQM